MSTAKDCRDRAEEMRVLGDTSKSAARKQDFYAIAAQWDALALSHEFDAKLMDELEQQRKLWN